MPCMEEESLEAAQEGSSVVLQGEGAVASAACSLSGAGEGGQGPKSLDDIEEGDEWSEEGSDDE